MFLTWQDDEVEDSKFYSINYTDIYKIISSIWKQYAHLNSEEVRVFIKHYLEVLQEMTGMSKKDERMKDLAKQLYQENKKVLDFIIKYGVSTEFATAVSKFVPADIKSENLFSMGNCEYIFHNRNNYRLSFLPKSWHEKLDKIKMVGLGVKHGGRVFRL